MTPAENTPGIRRVEIQDANGSSIVEEASFPLSIGGPEATLKIDDTSAIVAHLGLSEGEVFVQPESQHTAIVNGAKVDTSRWLGDGDVLRFSSPPSSDALTTSWVVVEIRGDLLRLTVRGDRSQERSQPPLIVPVREVPADTGVATIQPISFEPKAHSSGGRSRSWIGPFGLAVAVLLLALLAAAGFLLTSRSIEVAVEPAPDTLAIEGGLVFELGGRHVLRPGSYQLRAEKEGYTSLATSFEVTRESQQSFLFALEKLPGLLSITASVADAEVLVNGESLGTVPAEALELAAGDYEVTIRADRHREFTTQMQIEGSGTEHQLSAELEPLWAEVSFASQPAGARVRVDGEELGTTPLTAEVLEGGHSLQMVLAGYKPYRGKLDVVAGEPQELPATRLRPADGNLILTSEPTGATVSVAGVYRGETPLDLFLEPGRDHEVSVSMTGHDTEKRKVSLQSGKSQEVAVTLTPQEGEVQISAWPGDAELVIDGEARGSANQKITLTAVPHQIEVKKEGFVAHRQTVTPLPGVPQWVEVTLKPVGEAEREKKEAATPNVVTRHDHELRLIQPGKLRMGASRREPGRRANEVLREVELTRAFYLSAHEVSNRHFRKFKEQHASGTIAGHTLELDNHPAVRVTWDEAAAYCNWLSQQEGLPPAYVDEGGNMKAVTPMTTGYRLPTEAEWAWVTRYGGSGSTAQKYPWGTSLPVPEGSGNYADSSASGILSGVLSGYNDQHPVTAPVDSFSADAQGFFHLGDNVAEWVHDHYAIRFGGSQTVERDPLGPVDGDYHVIRGSSWMHSTVTELRLTYRDYSNQGRPDVGFRIARYAE